MTTLTFAVRRREPVLVGPATATPRETKRLFGVDNQEVLRMHVPFVFFYRGGRGVRADDDPVAVIRRALAEALVPYYPLAGRLREVREERKLVVDCTGEGVMFVEADADVRLADLEAADHGLRPPFPCMDQLLFDVEGSGGVVDCPLLHFQVTRLLCGGFALALRLNHTVCDAIGLAQFMSAVAELARGGLPTLTVEPVWSRELLEPRRPPPEPIFPHRELDAVPPPPPSGDMVMRTFTFGPADVTAIKKKNGFPPNLRDTATSFEAVTAALWRARTAALELPPDDEVRLVIIVNIRSLPELLLPAGGYYGNACVPTAAVATAGALLAGSLGDAVELVRKAKAAVTAEYVLSNLARQPYVARPNTFVVTDHRHAGFHRVHLGWGQPVYGGIANAAVFGVTTLVTVKNGDGEDAMGVFIVLPQPAMDRFASEVQMLLIKG